MSREGLLSQFQARGIQVTMLKYGEDSVSVYQGVFQGYAAAVKVLALAPGSDSAKLETDCQALMSLSHPNILRLYDCFWESNGVSYFFVIITEWGEKDLAKELQQRAENRFPWGEEELRNLTIELVKALTCMQEQGISHRDIKPENIFLTSTKSAKLGDFGCARVDTPLSPSLKSSEFVENSFKSDVFSLGLTLLSLTLLTPPVYFAQSNISPEEVQAVVSTLPCSDLFKSMLEWMLSVDEDIRCDFKTLFAWIEDHFPGLQSKTSEIGCLHCNKTVDLYRKPAQCEVVQLYCEPSKHMFCSRECCKTFLSLGIFKCPKCEVDIPNETVVFYLTSKSENLLPSESRGRERQGTRKFSALNKARKSPTSPKKHVAFSPDSKETDATEGRLSRLRNRVRASQMEQKQLHLQLITKRNRSISSDPKISLGSDIGNEGSETAETKKPMMIIESQMVNNRMRRRHKPQTNVGSCCSTECVCW